MPATFHPAFKSPAITAHPVTRGQHHFFGYYEKSPWDWSQRWMLGMKSAFMDRPPTDHDTLTIGLIDTKSDCAWRDVAETRAWNWQQGCMLQWLGAGRSSEIIFNDRMDGQFVARILNVQNGRERVLNRPVYGVNSEGTRGVSLSFSRLQHQRPGYGYAGVPDPWRETPEPEDDGLYLLDLQTGESRLILSIAEAANFRRVPEFDGMIHRFNHAQISPDGRHLAVLHRYKTAADKGVGCTRLLTLSMEGGDLRCLAHSDLVSHYDWKTGDSLLAWAREEGRDPGYFLYSRNGDLPELHGAEVFSSDGHCSFSPDRRWMLTDTYPDETDHRTLILYHWESGERIDIGRFYAPPTRWQIRCDLHPRWSRDGRHVCVDSVHEGTRQMYVLDVSDVVGS